MSPVSRVVANRIAEQARRYADGEPDESGPVWRRAGLHYPTVSGPSRRFIATVAIAGVLAGCSRDALDGACPDVSAGELVVTEVRGDQSGTDGYGQWIELYNASPAAVDLRGLEVHVQRVDGGADGHLLVRETVTLAAGGYAVLGRFPPTATPDHVDYGYVLPCEDTASGCGDYWLDTNLYDAAGVDLNVCGERIDRAIYRDLPSRGSWALSGAAAPDAAANDDEAGWCVDDAEDSSSEQLGIRGTPGEANPSC